MLFKQTSSSLFLLATVLTICLAPGQLFALDEYKPTFVQALVGAAQFSEDDLTFTEDSTSNDSSNGSNDLSTMPYLGMAFQYPFHGKNTQLGIDGSFFFGWRSKDTRVRGGSGNLAISIDSSLWLLDLSSGLYVKHTFNNRWRTYVAAGPVLMFGEYSEDTDEEEFSFEDNEKYEKSDSAFGVGAYARGGFDYLFGSNAYIGICVRGVKTNIEFDDAPDASSSLSGVQGFLTFSRYF